MIIEKYNFAASNLELDPHQFVGIELYFRKSSRTLKHYFKKLWQVWPAQIVFICADMPLLGEGALGREQLPGHCLGEDMTC